MQATRFFYSEPTWVIPSGGGPDWDYRQPRSAENTLRNTAHNTLLISRIMGENHNGDEDREKDLQHI